MAQLKLYLLGYPHIQIDHHPVEFQRHKTLALAAYLALESGNHQISQSSYPSPPIGIGRDTLAAMFWPDANQERAGANLRQALWEFSRATGEGWVLKQDQAVLLNPQMDIWVDAVSFELALENWKASGMPSTSALQNLVQAVDLYQGNFMAGFSLRDSPLFDDWQTFHSELFGLHFSQALESLVNALIRQQEPIRAVDYARRWLEQDPLNETIHCTLMNLYFMLGEFNSIERQYEQCQRKLRQELGKEPSAETTDLYKRLVSRTTPTTSISSLTRSAIPSGTVTFLFSDIEGSTRLWENHPQAMQAAFSRQEALMRQVMDAHDGYIYKMIGDSFQVAFSTAQAALEAALEAQRRLHAEDWGQVGEIKIRMALHTGVTEERGKDYVGPELNRVARIMSAGYGGQILLSQPTAELVRAKLPDRVVLQDLGERRLRDLIQPEHIYQASTPDLPADFPPLRTLDLLSGDLPSQTTAFVGREHELEQIETLLSNPECRIITLLGIGGAGKTRLAIQAAGKSRYFAHNACFISLAEVHSLDDMILAIAQAVKFKFQVSPRAQITQDDSQEQLLHYLADKKVLLVLDNFEQLVNYAGFIGSLVERALQVKLIITSRERLNLPGEWVLEILGLPFPGKTDTEKAIGYPAVQLFVRGAQRNTNFSPSTDDWPAIVRICQLVEGIPLGIEMAAAWVKMLSCKEIAAEIEHDLDFLSSSWRGMPERHQTLRAVFEYSWRLLSDRERDSFARLAVFNDHFTRQAAQEVSGVSILLLSSLTDKSFLRRSAPGWYEIHPVLSQYGYEKLAADPALLQDSRQRHAVYFIEWLYQMNGKLKGSQQLEALTDLRAAGRNLRNAFEWLVQQHDFQRIERVLPAIILLNVMNDQFVVTQVVLGILKNLLATLEATQEHPSLMALVLGTLRFFTNNPKYQQESNAYQRQCLLLLPKLPDNASKAYISLLNCIGFGELVGDQLLELCLASQAIFKRLGYTWEIALTDLVLGDIYNLGNIDLEKARSYYQASMDAFASMGNDWGRSICLSGLTLVARRSGQLNEAYQYGREGLEILLKLGSVERMLYLRYLLAEIAVELDLPNEAREHLNANLSFFTQIGNQRQQEIYQSLLQELEHTNSFKNHSNIG